VQAAVEEFLVFGDLLILEPHVELLLDELHLKLRVAQAMVVNEHTLCSQLLRDVFAPAYLHAHAKQVFILERFLCVECGLISRKLYKRTVPSPSSFLIIPWQHQFDLLDLTKSIEHFREHESRDVLGEVSDVEVVYLRKELRGVFVDASGWLCHHL